MRRDLAWAVVIVVSTGGAGWHRISPPHPLSLSMRALLSIALPFPIVRCLALSVDVHVDGAGAVTAFEPATRM
jgi:hypothetical protein